MIRLTLLPLGKVIDVQPGTVLLDAIRQNGVEISSPCNGRQLCGKCKVRIANPAPGMGPRPQHLSQEAFDDGLRLACQVAIEADMQITLPEDHALDARILEGQQISKSRIAPAAHVRETDRRFYLHYRNRPPVLLNNCWQMGFVPKGIAVDLGTTTVVVTLIDLKNGDELATASAVNPQTRFGHDVMTRIQKGSRRNGLLELAKLISDGLNALFEKACHTSGTHPHEIVDVVIGGNTTMLQIAAAIDPAPLGVVPFNVGIQSGRSFPAEQFRLNINPQARVYVPPVAHAFVGSDISAGLLSIDPFKSKEPILFLDLGTNGEIALIADGKLVVTSTAAGPAFEGMGITHGMRASTGAIEMVWSNGRYLNLRTIDEAPPNGICGSGIMDVMANLIKLKVVESSGLLKRPPSGNRAANIWAQRFEVLDRVSAIKLANQVYFTQKDIRQFQLAKSAIQTGMDMLLCAVGVKPDQLKKIIFAGGFGYHLKIESMRQIGIVPHEFKGDIVFAGNTSRTGCARMVLDTSSRDYLEKQMKRVRHLSTAEQPDFQSRFIENTALY